MLRMFGTQRIKPRQFNYQPRTYKEEDKDSLEYKLRRHIKHRLDEGKTVGSTEDMRARIRNSFQIERGRKPKTGLAIYNGRAVRLIVILILLSGGAYIFLEKYLPTLVERIVGG